MPTPIVEEVKKPYAVVVIGLTDEVCEQFYATRWSARFRIRPWPRSPRRRGSGWLRIQRDKRVKKAADIKGAAGKVQRARCLRLKALIAAGERSYAAE